MPIRKVFALKSAQCYYGRANIKPRNIRIINSIKFYVESTSDGNVKKVAHQVKL